MKLNNKIRIKNTLGLHARPATQIAKILQSSRSQVFITYKKKTINARSIMSILFLAVGRNAHILLSVEGEDAEETMKRLVEAFENRFGEN